MRRGLLLAGIAALLFVATRATSPTVSAAPKEEGPKVGTPAPAIEGTDIDGKPIKLSDFKGKLVMVDFFGDW